MLFILRLIRGINAAQGEQEAGAAVDNLKRKKEAAEAQKTDFDEQSLLATLLCDGGEDVIKHCHASGITADDFEVVANGVVFESLSEIDANGGDLNEISLLQNLRERKQEDEAGGISNIYQIQDRVDTSMQGRYFADRVKARADRRIALRKVREARERLDETDSDPAAVFAELVEFAPSLAPKTNSEPTSFVDPSNLWDSEIMMERPSLGNFGNGKALFYKNETNGIIAKGGSGKTWLSLLVTIERMNSGDKILFIDPESSHKKIAVRLRYLGMPKPQPGQFQYLGTVDPLEIKKAQAWAKGQQNLVVIVDGIANAISGAGIEENGSGALEVLHRLLRPFRDAGATVIAIDHTGKDQSKGGRGHSSKRDFFKGALLRAEIVVPFTSAKSGHMRLVVDKDNEGQLSAPEGKTVAEFHAVCSEGHRTRFDLREPSHDADHEPEVGAKSKETDDQILKMLPFGEDRAMRFDQMPTSLSRARFVERVRSLSIDGARLGLKSTPTGQQSNHFWRISTDEQ